MEHHDPEGQQKYRGPEGPQHCDPETLAVAAVGEPALDGRDAEHLLGCTECADELARLRATVALTRGSGHAEAAPAMPPPDRVWTAVAAELGLSSAPRPTRQVVAPVATRRTPRWLPAAAAAVVLAAASGAVGAAVAARDEQPSGAVLAQAALEPLEVSGATGAARWRQTPGGAVLQVELTGGEGAGYLEVWLLDPEDGRLVSLGSLLAGAAADLPVPEGIDPADYPYVDVSAEPLDGDPTHSGVSVARGDLVPTD